MSRTTLDVDDPILREIKRIQQQERQSLGKTVSALLADALARRRKKAAPAPFEWISRPLGARLDVMDKDAVWAVLDEKHRAAEP